MARAIRSSPSASMTSPFALRARTFTRFARRTSSRKPGMLRQPSSPVCFPSLKIISGLMRTTLFGSTPSSPPEVSITVRRLWISIWGAARPRPCEAYMVSNMSSTSCSSSGVPNSSSATGAAGFSRLALLMYLTTLCVISKLPHLFEVAVVVPLHFVERIASEFFNHGSGEHDGDHRFSDDAGRGDHADVGTFVRGFGRLAGREIDGFERTAQSRDRFEEAADTDFLTVRHAAFETAGAIVAAEEPAVALIVMDRILHFRAEAGGAFFRPADLHAFDGLHGDDGLGELAIEPGIPGDVGAEANGDATRRYFKDAADGVSGSISFVDQGFHTGFGFGIDAAEEDFFLLAEGGDFVPRDGAFEPLRADRDH